MSSTVRLVLSGRDGSFIRRSFCTSAMVFICYVGLELSRNVVTAADLIS